MEKVDLKSTLVDLSKQYPLALSCCYLYIYILFSGFSGLYCIVLYAIEKLIYSLYNAVILVNF